jgi:hypothetical protein
MIVVKLKKLQFHIQADPLIGSSSSHMFENDFYSN